VNIGFVGLGTGMAERLLGAGHALTVYNRSADKAAELVARGAVQVPAAAAGGGVVFSMLTDDAAVERVCAGADGIVAGLPEGGVHVSCSTITAAAGARLASLRAAAGRGFARVRGRD